MCLNSANLFSFQKQCLIVTIKSFHNLTLLAILPFPFKEKKLFWLALGNLELNVKDSETADVFNVCTCKHIIFYLMCI